ncbi:hypothetical protein TVAG_394940 [Trichomonas vaginalis G3]|uniref:Surface antigen BspA-like n=1 Tax=Trichomonas vaginalis (strain ATCC PRA-98 / G3) TaxID=412133 RepID=A2EDF8_TRIV3|nr:ribonuclease inhibitor domain-containing protein [Trichomonas vaginalis G3]EAY09322.1 hypothetical protein TVAG_394940 [Trichomonas vaginalis G3]KAI5510839.1 ribonuclease inhibitor domain-containing protein [Trichomonas vaginalis G3]|eukprot:XP_001321545.1 hypothetical protein [Trichomonas vaginalis G3]
MSQGVQYDSDDRYVLIKLPSGTRTFTVPSSVQRIQAGKTGNSAFLLCKSTIQSVYFEQNSQLTDLQSFCFSETSVETVDFSHCNNLIIFTESLFSNCLSLQSIIFPPNLEQIGKDCFSSSSITSLDIPNSVTIINDFQDCKSLTSISITSNSNLKSIGILKNLAISQFYIPKSVTSIKYFPKCPISIFTVHQENPNLNTDGTAIYNKTFSVMYCISSYISFDYNVNNKVRKITENCFTGSNINTLSFPQHPIELSREVFYTSSIKNLVFNNEMYLKEIPLNAISWNSKLTSVTLPETLTVIGNYSFSHCTS